MGWHDIFTFSWGYTQRGTDTNNSSPRKASTRSYPTYRDTKDVTPTGALVSNLLCTVQRQTSLIEEQNDA